MLFKEAEKANFKAKFAAHKAKARTKITDERRLNTNNCGLTAKKVKVKQLNSDMYAPDTFSCTASVECNNDGKHKT